MISSSPLQRIVTNRDPIRRNHSHLKNIHPPPQLQYQESGERIWGTELNQRGVLQLNTSSRTWLILAIKAGCLYVESQGISLKIWALISISTLIYQPTALSINSQH
jgi:hypothetical protein